jgi:hypothetical protein
MRRLLKFCEHNRITDAEKPLSPQTLNKLSHVDEEMHFSELERRASLLNIITF